MESLTSISCLTRSEVHAVRKNQLAEQHAKALAPFAESDAAFYSFSTQFMNHLPFALISSLEESQIIPFYRAIFTAFDARKKKKYHISGTPSGQAAFKLGNFAVIVMVTGDRPFIFDSVWSYFTGKTFRQQYMLHPIFSVKRDKSGSITAVEESSSSTKNESCVVLFLDEADQDAVNAIVGDMTATYEDIIACVDDFDEMNRAMRELADSYRSEKPEMDEFIRWMLNGNFILQGVRVADVNSATADGASSDYGIFKNLKLSQNYRMIADTINNRSQNFVENFPVEVEKSRLVSNVKRRRNFNRLVFFQERAGGICRVVTVLGLFTQAGVKAPPHEIAILRKRVQAALSHFNFVHGSHDYKWIRDILDNFPKTELFTFDEKVLIEILELILSMHGVDQIRICYRTFLPRKNLFFFMTLPSGRFSMELVGRIGEFLSNYFKATLIDTAVREDVHRAFYVHFHLLVDSTDIFDRISDDSIKEGIVSLLKHWEEKLMDVARIRGGITPRQVLEYIEEKNEAYRAKTTAGEAYDDIVALTALQNVSCRMYPSSGTAVLKIYSKQSYLLTELMPVIDHMGLKVVEHDAYEVKMGAVLSHINAVFLAEVKDAAAFCYDHGARIADMVTAVLSGRVESDPLNQLILSAGLTWRQIDILRAVRNMIRQYAENFLIATLNRSLWENPAVAAKLVAYFEEKFDPAKKTRSLDSIEAEILAEIDKVASVSIDRALRSYLMVIKGMVRTNFYMQPVRDYISFKVKSGDVEIIKQPKPLFEIYVHDANMEGVHLRGGRVARGGLRFSDRPDDFRTEVLGLVKTQIVKNAVIVPTGSKGGFIVKKRYPEREKDAAHIVSQYSTFIKGLLDITDNYNKTGKVVHPKHVVIWDDKDPYLVVAADKGTATFSDIANGISIDYGFWLGDAFASGGSTGYDHKKVGITAMGGWECVKRHFREMGKDIQKELFTVIGIGDMSGDVFGNGMLLSKKIQLQAAFNHMHIFIDPTPDADSTYQERVRLFKKPRSTWADYNTDLISAGGGVFERAAKKIVLTPEMKKMLGVTTDAMTGEELIRSILTMEVELLWNGGIGTYVKASSETHSQVGDSANDNVRVDADEIRAKVIGEGGNLGMTQNARIALGLRGVRLNTDALDNSAGVDMSDHEVNLKIMMDRLVLSGRVQSVDERNRIIRDLTGSVRDLVLRDNYDQSMTVSCDQIRFDANPVTFRETALFLKARAGLDFRIERIMFVDHDHVATRPELAVMLAYTKIFIANEIEHIIDLDNPLYLKEYLNYYPEWLRENYRDELLTHPLRRQITVTAVVNKVVNNAGITFFIELAKNLHVPLHRLVESYLLAAELLGARALREQVEALDNRADADAQYRALIEIEKTLKVAVEWLVDADRRAMLEKGKDMFADICWMLPGQLPRKMKKHLSDMVDEFVEARFPKKTAQLVAQMRYLKPAFDVYEISRTLSVPYQDVMRRYFIMETELDVNSITVGIKKVRIRNEWERVNRESILRRVKELQKELAAKCSERGDAWFDALQEREEEFFRYLSDFVRAVHADEIDSLVPYNVMVDGLAKVVRM